MRTIQKRDPKKEQDPAEEGPQHVNPYPAEAHIADGGEFLDDSLRMKDQPLEEKQDGSDQQTKSQTKNSMYYEMF